MSREDNTTRVPPPPPPKSPPPAAGSSGARVPFQFSLRTLAVVVTSFCVLLGLLSFASGLGPVSSVSVFAELVYLVTGVLIPVAAIVALIYARGYAQTFLIGVAVAIVLRRFSSGDSRFYQFDLATIIRMLIVGVGYVAAGVVAVMVRRTVQSRGWDRGTVDRRDQAE